MAVNDYNSLGNWETTFAILTGAANDVVYTVPAAYPAILVTQIRCTDDGGAARTIEVIASKSGTSYTLASPGTIIPANDALDLQFNPLVLKQADIIKATGSAAGIHVQVSFAPQPRQHT